MKKKEINKQIDCRGLECPRPVVDTKQALEEIDSGTITVVVDNQGSLKNIKRFVRKDGYTFKVRNEGDEYYIDINKKETTGKTKEEQLKHGTDRYTVFITSDRLGSGDKRLGEILIKAFLNTLWEAEKKPESIILINNGVKLGTEGSEVLDSLELLEKEGIHIISCGTCLAYYKLTDKLKIGLTSNMYEIVNILIDSPKIVRI
jgi:selenium metabolism protein YedF